MQDHTIPKPMPLQSTNMLDIGAQTLALSHALQALVRAQPKGQRDEFIKHLSSFAPSGQVKAYTDVIADMKKAAG